MLRIFAVLGSATMAAGALGNQCDNYKKCGTNEQCMTSTKTHSIGGTECHKNPVLSSGGVCGTLGTSRSSTNNYKCGGSMSCFGDKVAGYKCRAPSSTGPCHQEEDCVEASFCKQGSNASLTDSSPGNCTAKLPLGSSCVLSKECRSEDCYTLEGETAKKCNTNRLALFFENVAAGFGALVVVCILIPIILGILTICLIWHCCCRKKAQVVVVQAQVQQPVSAQPVMYAQPGQQPMMAQPVMYAQPGQQPMQQPVMYTQPDGQTAMQQPMMYAQPGQQPMMYAQTGQQPMMYAQTGQMPMQQPMMAQPVQQ